MEKLHNSKLNNWLGKLEVGHNKKIDLGLKRVKIVYDSLKLDKVAPTIITVAGTNGKGSTVAILASICAQAGYKVGAFTSPHIQTFNERIVVNEKQANDTEIVAAFELIEENLNGVTLSYFEYATLAALVLFKLHKVDLAILEVGLGGRLDSVNVVDSDCAIITTIDIDHTDWLGDNIESIAKEKAGIMRANKPVVYGDDNCPQSIIDHAKELNAHLTYSDKSIAITRLNILGNYQFKNARTAITALNQLKSQLSINQNHINNGLIKVQLQGRLQIVSQKPTLIIDVSHNQQAALSLAHWLKQNPIEGKTFAVFAVLEDKHVRDWINEFKNLIDVWCISQINSERTMSTNELLLVLVDSAKFITSFESVQLALKAAKIMTNDEDRILVFGSFYTVGDALAG